MTQELKFEAQIKDTGKGGAYVEIPVDTFTYFGKKGIIKVHATFDDYNYRGALAPMEKGRHFLGIRKDIRKAINKEPGDFICVTIKEDNEPRVVEVPNDFRKALDDNPAAAAIFDEMGFTHKKEYVNAILEAKKPETRERRILKAIENISSKGKTK